ncbi:MAG: hypothetical protein G01um101438_66 [Parcubacteria group bacterium Gr01-1014_38]|nr:MAG: hypothetical protein G01um101438_66 [Parcubacteria group bacterium Gr01-1014_38]
MNEWAKKGDEELLETADIGLRGQGALVEMLRRLKNSTARLSVVNAILSVVMFLAALVQIYLTWKSR